MSEEITPEVKEKNESYFGEIVRFAIIVAVVLLPIRLFVAKPFIVSGSSMDPTFNGGEYLVIDELSYRFKPPLRGDVIVFKYPLDTSKYFIKRIIGLPGETVSIEGSVVTIHNSKGDPMTLTESYVAYPSNNTMSRTLGPDEYFAMGDNRAASSDSRSWGPVPREDITGKVFARLFPVTKIGLHPGY